MKTDCYMQNKYNVKLSTNMVSTFSHVHDHAVLGLSKITLVG